MIIKMFGFSLTHICLLAATTIAIIGTNLHLATLPAWFFMTQVSNDSISAFLRDLTLHPHLAGTPQDFATADYVRDKLSSFGLSTHIVDYQVLLSYPLSRSLSVVYSNNSSLKLGLDEDPVDGGDASGVVKTFFAYSPSGSALAEVVYANYGQSSDFDDLKRIGVDVRGSVVIARLGKSFRGDIVLNAQREGAAAVVLYPDPQDYATNATADGYYPSSRWMPPSGVQRGSVLLVAGDPLTPGWPSTKVAERVEIKNRTRLGMPEIPALPISARDALEIISALGGPVAPSSWQGGLAVDVYRVGKGPVKLDFCYEANETIGTIRNVFGVLEGTERDRYVLVGNHRDAWTYGAADPNSGTACLLEMARIFGKFMRKPARTIVFCSWDAEEYSLTGSTEWVEENLAMLSSRAVAYLNVDEAVTGSSFSASATPQLDDIIIDVTKMVKDPNSNGTIFDSWCANTTNCVKRLGGGGSDYAPFLQHAGIPSMDITFKNENVGYPVYHSLYDSYNWMKKFGDPDFNRHAAVVKVWGLVAKRLAMATTLPFNFVTYATVLEIAVKDLEEQFLRISVDAHELNKSHGISFVPLYSALDQLRESRVPSYPVRSANDLLMLGEHCFIDPEGLPGKPWFKHLIYGPTDLNVYGTQTFPAIADAISSLSHGEVETAKKDLQHEIWRASRAVQCVANVIKGNIF